MGNDNSSTLNEAGLESCLGLSHNEDSIINPEKEAITALFRSTGQIQWRNHSGWDSDVPLKDWHGVKVNSTSHIAELDISSNNLKGFFFCRRILINIQR